MYVAQHPVRRVSRRMNSVAERGVVSNIGVGSGIRYYDYSGLSGLEGTVLQNISRIVGGVFSTVATGGLIWLAPKKIRISAERITGALITSGGVGASIAPKAWGLSKSEANITRGITAAAAVVGGGIMLAPMMASGTALTSVGTSAVGTAKYGSDVIGIATGQVAATTGSGILSTLGSGLKAIGSGIWTGVSAIGGQLLPVLGGLVTGGGGGGGGEQQQQQQGGMTQAEFDAAQQAAAQEGARQQADAYAQQVALQQSQMYDPGMMYTQVGQPGPAQAAYGDLRSPYTAITEDGETVQVDPSTGQIIQPAMSTGTMILLGGVTLLAGWYFMSGSKKIN